MRHYDYWIYHKGRDIDHRMLDMATDELGACFLPAQLDAVERAILREKIKKKIPRMRRALNPSAKWFADLSATFDEIPDGKYEEMLGFIFGITGRDVAYRALAALNPSQ